MCVTPLFGHLFLHCRPCVFSSMAAHCKLTRYGVVVTFTRKSGKIIDLTAKENIPLQMAMCLRESLKKGVDMAKEK